MNPSTAPGKGEPSGAEPMPEQTAVHCFHPAPRNMDLSGFLARFAGIYEHSPWIAEAAHRSGLTPVEDTPAGLATALAKVVAAADENAKLTLIRAHPDLAGRAAIAGELTSQSKAEQSGAGLDSCTPEEFARFHDLNERYKRRFGFPFVIAVAGKTRSDILAAFEERAGNDPEAEFRAALREIDKIARMRLEALASA